MPGLASYMAQYDHEHASGWNKLLHGIGIPLIFAGIVLLLLMKWIWGGSFFAAGWVLLFWGRNLEGKQATFVQGPIYLLVGPSWVANEVWTYLQECLTGKRSSGASEARKTEQ